MDKSLTRLSLYPTEEQKELFFAADQKVATASLQHPAASELIWLIYDSLDSLPVTAQVISYHCWGFDVLTFSFRLLEYYLGYWHSHLNKG